MNYYSYCAGDASDTGGHKTRPYGELYFDVVILDKFMFIGLMIFDVVVIGGNFFCRGGFHARPDMRYLCLMEYYEMRYLGWEL